MEDYKIKDENNIENNDETETTDNGIDSAIKDDINSKKIENDNSEKESIFNLRYAKPVIFGNVLLIIALLALLFTNFTSLKEANTTILNLTAEVENMKNTVSSIVDVANDVKFMGNRIDDLGKSTFLNQLSLEVSEGIVTDKVVIQKAVLYSYDDVLNGYIDIKRKIH